jgi:hypothetical protein
MRAAALPQRRALALARAPGRIIQAAPGPAKPAACSLRGCRLRHGAPPHLCGGGRLQQPCRPSCSATRSSGACLGCSRIDPQARRLPRSSCRCAGQQSLQRRALAGARIGSQRAPSAWCCPARLLVPMRSGGASARLWSGPRPGAGSAPGALQPRPALAPCPPAASPGVLAAAATAAAVAAERGVHKQADSAWQMRLSRAARVREELPPRVGLG